jgi:hypothetical protein
MKNKYAIEFDNDGKMLVSNSNVPTLVDGQRIEFELDDPVIEDILTTFFIKNKNHIAGKLINIHYINNGTIDEPVDYGRKY